ncbi:MAG: DUF885 domain-containing protein, partial [Bacteroidia bacterium]|nr:DUF885 domain-containing protein [Bacteroidia bacterium]
IDTLREYEWNPAMYNLGEHLDQLLNNKELPLSKRLEPIAAKLKHIPQYYATGLANLKKPTKEHTELAIQQVKGSLAVFQMIEDSLKKAVSVSPDVAEEIRNGLKECRGEVNHYIKQLETVVLPKAKTEGRSFRLGKELHAQKFAYDIVSDYTAEGIYQEALKHKAYLHGEMLKLTDQLWSKYMGNKPKPEGLKAVKELITKISEKHVKRDEFVSAIKAQIPELTRFVEEKKLLYLDPKKPLVVRETPLYMRGVAGASISSPGPYEKNGNTYYNVTPLDDMTPEQAESYLREYNHYILQILNIHEAIPGHYAQLVYSNQSPSLIKSIFGNGAMIEGWAVYTERMMLEEGYGNHEPEMWLMYYKWNLRATLNTILDYSVHAGNLSETDALRMLMEEGFQEEAEAKGKWRRATLTQVQLCSYFTGFKEIYNLREELKKKGNFNLKNFHETFLSYGSSPVKYIRLLMTKQ